MPLDANDKTRLTDMRHYAEMVQRIVADRTWEAFEADDTVKLAAVRCVEVIGEAGHKVSAEVQRSISTIPWHLMWNMRNRLIHDYGNTDFRIVYKVFVRNCRDFYPPSPSFSLNRKIPSNSSSESWADKPLAAHSLFRVKQSLGHYFYRVVMGKAQRTTH
jgi:uncharacterized protein with HEPN domain